MGGVRVNQQRLSALLSLVGWVAILGGVAWLWGPGWAAIAGGALAVAAAVLLYDPAAKSGGATGATGATRKRAQK